MIETLILSKKKTYFPYVFIFDTFFFGKSYIREIIDFIAFSDVFWLSKHDPAIILSKITDLDSFWCYFRSFHERPKKSQKIGGWKWSKYPVKSVIFEFLWTKLVFFGRTRPETVSKPVFFKIQFFTKKKRIEKKNVFEYVFFSTDTFNHTFKIFRIQLRATYS